MIKKKKKLKVATLHCFAPRCSDNLPSRTPVARLVEHWAVTQEVSNSTPAELTLRVLKCCLCNDINKRLDDKPEVMSLK